MIKGCDLFSFGIIWQSVSYRPAHVQIGIIIYQHCVLNSTSDLSGFGLMFKTESFFCTIYISGIVLVFHSP